MSDKNKKKDSALSVQQGIDQPPPVSDEVANRFRGMRKHELSAEEYVKGIRAGDRSILSRAITLTESSLEKHQQLAQQIITQCIPFSGNSIRVGITGVPGVGKSTFIESLGIMLTQQDRKIAVLAIDPSSFRSKGSILGDKTRMEDLANDPNAYIRPSSSSGTLGGVARKTRESIYLCEAAGFDVIFVETVGVGQSETAVHSMVDFFLLLMLAGAGDELQGIKRGIMEMADTLVINKADGDNVEKARMARVEYSNALHLFPLGESGWSPKVLICSAIEHSGIEEVWATIEQYRESTIKNGYFKQNRNDQAVQAMLETIDDSILNNFYQNEQIAPRIEVLKQSVLSGQKSPYQAASELLKQYFEK